MNKLTAFTLTALLLAPLAALAADRPNVVLILADDLGARDLSCFGSTYYETPNIDRLASRGVRLTNAYAASPLCSPTRASIMVGQHPARTGINGIEWHGNLPPIDIAARMIRDERFQYIVNYSSTPRGATSERGRQPDDRYAANAEKLDVLPLLAAHPDRPELQRFIRPIKAPRPREELYDCVADPDQLQNFADKPEFAEVKAKLRARLEAYQRQTNDGDRKRGQDSFSVEKKS
jgi:hypothetical protein